MPCAKSFVCLLALHCHFLAVSATNCAPTSGIFTIKTDQDVANLGSCATFTGDIVVAADGPENVTLTGVVHLSGNIDIENVANLRSLSSTTLQSVSTITLQALPLLETLSLPNLKNFSSLKWNNLPSIKTCDIATGSLEGEIQDITIYNTNLNSLDWLSWPIGGQLNITNNPNLKSFKIPFAKLNTGSTLTFVNNTNLDNLDVSALSGIYGALDVSDTGVKQLSFDHLETIGGYVRLSGDFTNVSMPALNQVSGALNVESTGDISSLCDSLQQKASSTVLQGHYDCESNIQKSQSSNNPTTTSRVPASATSSLTTVLPSMDTTSKKTTTLSLGLKIALPIGIVTSTILVILFAFLYFRRRHNRHNLPIATKDTESSETLEMDAAEVAKELEASPSPIELSSGGAKERHEMEGHLPSELEGKHGATEVGSPVRYELQG